jgi:hypothetical protein
MLFLPGGCHAEPGEALMIAENNVDILTISELFTCLHVVPYGMIVNPFGFVLFTPLLFFNRIIIDRAGKCNCFPESIPAGLLEW